MNEQFQEAVPPLTRRETLVASLVAGGRTNNEVAVRLSISPYTVKGHLSAAMSKLNFTNRTQLAAWWWNR